MVGNLTTIVSDDKNVISKKSLVQQTKKKWDEISNRHVTFLKRYQLFVNQGLRSPWNKSNKLISQEAYKEMMNLERSKDEKFQDLEGILDGKLVLDKLEDDFKLLWSTWLFFQHNPLSYDKYI